MKKIFSRLASAAMILAFMSCSGSQFKIEGCITEAEDSTIYFENLGVGSIDILDSAVLDKDGNFAFSADKKEAPDFYRLRIANNIIYLSIDSTETVKISASYPSMPYEYKVEGSYNCEKIKSLSRLQGEITSEVISIFNDSTMDINASADSANRVISRYKDMISRDYIYKEPMKAYAYFALFQTISGRPIFNPAYGKSDVRAYSAVATSWDMYYPDSERAKNLHSITIEGIKNNRIVRNGIMQAQNELEQAREIDPTDISMTDNNGRQQKLSDLKGKVVMLDFHLFGHEQSAKRIMQMRDIYNKFHDRGFEIYQIAFDQNSHFWKTQTEALPWICVRPEEESQIIEIQNIYNVSTIPAYFLIDRNGVIQKRDIQVKDISSTIESML